MPRNILQLFICSEINLITIKCSKLIFAFALGVFTLNVPKSCFSFIARGMGSARDKCKMLTSHLIGLVTTNILFSHGYRCQQFLKSSGVHVWRTLVKPVAQTCGGKIKSESMCINLDLGYLHGQVDDAFDKGMENIIQQKYGASDMKAITDSVDKLQQQVKFRLVRTSLFFRQLYSFIQNKFLDNA